MKRFNKNIILFVLASVFVLSGFFGSFFNELKSEILILKDDLLSGDIYSLLDFKTKLDDLTNKELLYHDGLMDLNSVKDNLLGSRIINKDDSTIVKTESDKLGVTFKKLSGSDFSDIVNPIKDLEKHSKENGANFLYVAVPTKEYYEQFPSNVYNYAGENFDELIHFMQKEKVTYINPLSDVSEENARDLYFDTDHHWTPEAGLFATGEICKKLESLYGFECENSYLEIDNYNTECYKDYFLGSYGKKVGTYFTDKGADDFSVITPKFDTDLTEEQPNKNRIRSGTFDQTFLFLENIDKKDYYELNSYAVYSGGDFRLQIMRNNLNTTGKKILIIRDSFACAVTPFLALQTSELHIVDIRDSSGYVGERINVYDYIESEKPDYVLVLYSGVSSVSASNGRYAFNPTN